MNQQNKSEGTTPQAEPTAAEFCDDMIANLKHNVGKARAVAPVETPDVPERLWCSYPDCHCEREHDGVCQYKRAVATFQEKYDRADKSPIILSWDDAYLILRMLKGGK